MAFLTLPLQHRKHVSIKRRYDRGSRFDSHRRRIGSNHRDQRSDGRKDHTVHAYIMAHSAAMMAGKRASFAVITLLAVSVPRPHTQQPLQESHPVIHGWRRGPLRCTALSIRERLRHAAGDIRHLPGPAGGCRGDVKDTNRPVTFEDAAASLFASRELSTTAALRGRPIGAAAARPGCLLACRECRR